jgi:hypothetical protein
LPKGVEELPGDPSPSRFELRSYQAVKLASTHFAEPFWPHQPPLTSPVSR